MKMKVTGINNVLLTTTERKGARGLEI